MAPKIRHGGAWQDSTRQSSFWLGITQTCPPVCIRPDQSFGPDSTSTLLDHDRQKTTHSGQPCHFQFLFLERGNQCIHVLLIGLRDSFYEILYGILNIKDQFIVPNQSIDSVGMAKVVEDLKDALGFLNTK